jgi:hypothetical protein
VLEIAIRTGSILDKCSQIMAYADDVVIMGRRLKDVEEVFTSLVEQTNKMGLGNSNSSVMARKFLN